MLLVLLVFSIWGETMIYVILVLSIIFLFFFCFYLCKKNKNLSHKVHELQATLELERNRHDTASVKFLSSNKVPIQEISKEIEDAINESEKRKSKIDSSEKKYGVDRIDEILKENTKDPFSHPYEKNVLNTIPSTLSSVGICNNETLKRDNKKGEVVMNEEVSKVNLNDFIRRDRGYIDVTSSEVSRDSKKENISFVEEISKKLEEQLGPQTIELTDYEKEQEENAIISYKELLKVKEQLYEINEAKENEEFLNDLKVFRSHLG